MMTITFLRHGESSSNATQQLQGKTDAPLSEKGKGQALTLARYWQARQVTFDLIISSNLQRAQATAGIIAEMLGLAVVLEPIWQERDFGRLEGMQIADIRQQVPIAELFHPFNSPGGDGESMMATFQRACQAVQDLVKRPAGRYLVVSHGAFLNMVLYAIFGLNPQNFAHGPQFIFDNAAFTELVYDPEGGVWRVLGFNLQAPA